MTCTTYLDESELNVPTSNKEVNDLLKELRTATTEDWQITEKFEKTGIFSKGRHSYQVFKYVGGMGPYQVMNFYKEDAESSINFGISADTLMAYMLGILVGMDSANRKMSRKINETTND